LAVTIIPSHDKNKSDTIASRLPYIHRSHNDTPFLCLSARLAH